MSTCYWEVAHSPDLTETGCLQQKTYIKTIWVGYLSQQYVEKEIVEDFCYARFGPKVAYIQGVAATVAWTVKPATRDLYQAASPKLWAGEPTETTQIILKIGDGAITLVEEKIQVAQEISHA